MSKKVNGFTVETKEDDLITIINYLENGVTIDTLRVDIGELSESPIANMYLVKSVMPMLSARCSGLKGLEKMQGFRDTLDLWATGEWSAERKGGVRTVSAEVEAIAEMTGQSISKAQTSWSTASDATKAAVALKPEFIEALASIKARRVKEANEATDLADLLS